MASVIHTVPITTHGMDPWWPERGGVDIAP